MSIEDPFYRSFHNRTSAISLLKYHKFQEYQLKNELREYVSFLPTRKRRFKIEDIYLSDDVCKVKLKSQKKKMYRNIIMREERGEGGGGGVIREIGGEVGEEGQIRRGGSRGDRGEEGGEISAGIKGVDGGGKAGERDGKIKIKEGGEKKERGKENGERGGQWHEAADEKVVESKESKDAERKEREEEEEEERGRKWKGNKKWNKNLGNNTIVEFHWKIKRTSQVKFEPFSKTSKNFRIKTAKGGRKDQEERQREGVGGGEEGVGQSGKLGGVGGTGERGESRGRGGEEEQEEKMEQEEEGKVMKREREISLFYIRRGMKWEASANL